MTSTSPRIRSLLRQASKTESVGKKKAAEQLYRQIVDEAPDTATAWLGLAQLAQDPAEQREAYERVLALDPENEVALQALDRQPPEGGSATKGPAVSESNDAVVSPKASPDEKAPPEQQSAQTEAVVLSAVVTDSAELSIPAKPVTKTQAASAVSPVTDVKPAEPEPVLAPIVAPSAEAPVHEVDETEELQFVCYRHPETETNLRCYNCSRPICAKCTKRTPVGYMCPICVHEAEEAFFSATLLDYLAAAAVALVLGLIGGFIARFIGFFVIFVAAGGGALIGRLSFRAARRHRGRYLPHLVAAMVVVGALVPSLGTIVLVLFNPGAFFSLLWPAVYLFLAPAAAYWQVK